MSPPHRRVTSRTSSTAGASTGLASSDRSIVSFDGRLTAARERGNHSQEVEGRDRPNEVVAVGAV